MKGRVVMMVVWLSAAGGSLVAKDSTVWNTGTLVLQNGIELRGELTFNWVAQVVRYRQGAITKAYSAHQVQEFAYLDHQSNTFRTFVTIDRQLKYGLRRPRILEQVLFGSVPVYRELYADRGMIKVGTIASYDDVQELQRPEDFSYLVYFDSELLSLNDFYRQNWPGLKSAFEKELQSYAVLSHTDMVSVIGRLRLINKYNYLASRALPTPLTEQGFVSADAGNRE